MPAPRKTWKPSSKESSRPLPDLSPVEALLPNTFPKPAVPAWAIKALLKALLNRDNRKIPPERADRVDLEYIVAYLDACHDEIEANDFTIPPGIKERVLADFLRRVLTARPRRHSSDVFKVHSRMVDLFLDKMKWPLKPRNDAKYKLSLLQHLPKIFRALAGHHKCGPQCPANSPTESQIKQKFWMVTSRSRLRETIVSFYHGIAPDSLRGPRIRRRTRRRKKLVKTAKTE